MRFTPLGTSTPSASPTRTTCSSVAAVGRPVARHLDDGLTLEVTRVATDSTPSACSILYAAAWQAAKALGYRRLITYTQKPLGFAISETPMAANWSTGATQ